MEEYHRDSLRELRRMAEERPVKKKGSFLVTLLIIALFLAAGGFYLKTEKPEVLGRWLDLKVAEQRFTAWREDVAEVFRNDPDAVKETVDSALEETDEKA